jgi:hypothetical protein
MGWIVALGAFALLAPLMAWLGMRYGRAAKGGVGLLLLGLGQVADPPVKHLVEANTGEEKEAPAPGDPPAA